MVKREVKPTDLGNVVILSSKMEKSPSYGDYCWSILLRLQPHVYNKYECIKIQAISSLIGIADYLVQILRSVGLVVVERKENVRIQAYKRSGGSYWLPNCIEITLKKEEFKVGDKVRVKEEVNSDMAGKEAIIEIVNKKKFGLRGEDNKWLGDYDEDEIEMV